MTHTIAGSIKFGESQLQYLRYGNGAKVLLCFHGYGQGKEYYELMAEALPDYSIFSFDLFFHGQSIWGNDEEPLGKSEWNLIIQTFLAQEDIYRFSICGYSMGGKFALACAESFSERIDKLILIAPDGIKTHFLYNLATYPSLLRRFFKAQILHPKLFLGISNTLQKLGLMDKGIIKFAKSQMNTVENRSRVYYTWVVFRNLEFNLIELAKTINTHQIELEMYLGSHDKIITHKNMTRLLKHLHHYQLHMVNSAHSSLIFNTAKFIKTLTK